MNNTFVPPTYQKLFCPYCSHPQNELNIEPRMYTNREWIGYTCENCGKLFAYIQRVERAYFTAAVKAE